MSKQFFIMALVFFLFLSGCTQQIVNSPTVLPNPPQLNSSTSTNLLILPVKGVSLSPKSFESSDFNDFFQKAEEAGNIVSWVGDWEELGNENGSPAVIVQLAKTYGYTAVIEAQFFTQSTGKLLRSLDSETKANYKKIAVAFAEKYKPSYLALGVEVNILYEKSPADFEAFSKFYGEVYGAIKSVSPNTKVFPIFQLEKMKGLHGGLFGGSNSKENEEWYLLDRFQDLDLVAFTTYPSLVYKSPSELKSEYYLDIISHTSKPIAFTEVGWPSTNGLQGWESSEDEQVQFVNLFFNFTSGVKPQFSIWSFLYDQKTIEPFNHMGLFYTNGSVKKAWSNWLAGYSK